MSKFSNLFCCGPCCHKKGTDEYDPSKENLIHKNGQPAAMGTEGQGSNIEQNQGVSDQGEKA